MLFDIVHFECICTCTFSVTESVRFEYITGFDLDLDRIMKNLVMDTDEFWNGTGKTPLYETVTHWFCFLLLLDPKFS